MKINARTKLELMRMLKFVTDLISIDMYNVDVFSSFSFN